MRVSIVQSSLVWENAAANRTAFSQKLASLRGQTDLVVLPEMFSTAFSMNAAALAEPMNGPTVQWLAASAGELDAAICGSFMCSENGRFHNRLIFMRPGGEFDFYDKKHLFTPAGEHEHYSAGNRQVTVEWRGWRIRPLVCYDLRFPVWSRQPNPAPALATPQEAGDNEAREYDLLIYVANWPTRRAHHWRALLLARAIENQTYTIGVNITGQDGNGLEYAGDSAVIDFSGQTIVQISGGEGVFTAELSMEDLQQYRRQLPFLQDADFFTLC